VLPQLTSGECAPSAEHHRRTSSRRSPRRHADQAINSAIGRWSSSSAMRPVHHTRPLPTTGRMAKTMVTTPQEDAFGSGTIQNPGTSSPWTAREAVPMMSSRHVAKAVAAASRRLGEKDVGRTVPVCSAGAADRTSRTGDRQVQATAWRCRSNPNAEEPSTTPPARPVAMRGPRSTPAIWSWPTG